MSTTLPLDDLLWTPQRLGDAVRALAAAAGLEPRVGVDAPRLPGTEAWASEAESAGEAVAAVARHFDLEAGPVPVTVASVGEFARHAEAALIQRPGTIGFVLLIRGTSRYVELLGPELRAHRVPVDRFQRWWLEHRYREMDSESSGPLREARADRREGLAAPETESSMSARGTRSSTGCGALRLPASRPFRQWVRRFRLPGEALRFVATYASAYALMVTSWWLLGAAGPQRTGRRRLADGLASRRVERGALLAGIRAGTRLASTSACRPSSAPGCCPAS